MSEARPDTLTIAPTNGRVNLGLFPPIGTPQVTAGHALAPGAQSLPSLMIAQPPDVLNLPQRGGQQYLSQGPLGPIGVGQSIDPSLMFMPGTGAHAAYEENMRRARDVAFATGPGQFEAFHGTGATFDRFLDEFIGTGEGAQAYSAGHYVAQRPGVAKAYMPSGYKNLTLDGEPWNYDSVKGPYHPTNLAHDYVMDHEHVGSAIDTLEKDLKVPGFGTTREVAGQPAEGNWAEDTLAWMKENEHRIGFQDPGHLLNVWVKPDHEEFLDWDLPHNEQESGVQRKLSALGDKIGASEWRPAGKTGQEIYEDVKNYMWDRAVNEVSPATRSSPSGWVSVAGNQGAISDRAELLASKELDAAGIPGMRFLDRQSRGLPEGHPDRTYNYVVYNPENLEITHRNGRRLIPVDHDPFTGGGQ